MCIRDSKHLDVSICEAVLGTAPEWYRNIPFVDEDGDTDSPTAPAFLGSVDLSPADQGTMSEAMHGFMDDDLAAPLTSSMLRTGQWLHPLIPGATVDVSNEDERGCRVEVSAMGYQLFSAAGEVIHIENSDRYAVISVGTAELIVPFEALMG